MALYQPRIEFRSDRNGKAHGCDLPGHRKTYRCRLYDEECNLQQHLRAHRTKKKSNENIRRVTLNDILRERKERTDQARGDAVTDEDIECAMRDDPDWADFIDIDWSKAEVVYPTAKKPLSILLDQEVVDFFQASGKGYQTRINAVLHHYVQ